MRILKEIDSQLVKMNTHSNNVLVFIKFSYTENIRITLSLNINEGHARFL